jgi:alcohol dehydrogenase class IV
MAHALESILCLDANDMSDLYAYKAVELLTEGLQRLDKIQSAEEINEDTRDLLYTASLIAGYSLNITGTCFPHTVGYILTERFNIPHGRACAAFTPEFLERGRKHMPEKTEKVLKAANMNFDDFVALIKRLAAIPELRLSQEEIDKIALRWNDSIKNFCRTPGGYTAADAKSSLISVVKPL